MIYTKEFKDKCFNTLRFCKVVDINKLMNDLDSERHTNIRYALEASLSDPSLYAAALPKVLNQTKIEAYRDRKRLYSEFMEMYVNLVLDGNKKATA